MHYATTVCSSEKHVEHPLPSSHEALEQIFSLSKGLDLVGAWASGVIYRGFANSLGQKNWHSQNSFNFDWSIYQHEDKSVKCGYAGFDWQQTALENKFQHAKQALQTLTRPKKPIKPGQWQEMAELCEQTFQSAFCPNWLGCGSRYCRYAGRYQPVP